MNRIVFLLEERSMKVFLEELLPRVFPHLEFLCVPHEGKNDLEKSIPRKLRAWTEPGVRFVVVRDNDGGDCRKLKQRLLQICERAKRPDTLIRLAVQELEAWYFGDLLALASAFGDPGLAKLDRKRKYRDPDEISQPSMELQRLIPGFQKLKAARAMGQAMNPGNNESHSFNVFLQGLHTLLSEGGEPTHRDSRH